MSTKYPGGLISKTAPVPTGPYANSEAPGVWTLEQQAYWVEQGNWPTAGNVDPSAFIENLFSTYLYTGNGSTQTITNGIDLAGEGGLVWCKFRNDSVQHALYDTARGVQKELNSASTSAQITRTNGLTSFSSTGFVLGSDSVVNQGSAPNNYASWTFRKQPKFFDVVTYTGNGNSGPQTISHNLGSVPGVIICKSTTSVTSWGVYHRSLGATKGLYLNLTQAEQVNNTLWNDTAPTSTTFTVGASGGSSSSTNEAGQTYVAYLFAHNAGGFGLSGTDNVISCGSYTGTGTDQSISLGFEPQWVMIKKSSGISDWAMFDNMRGAPVLGVADSFLKANGANAEYNAEDWVEFYAEGFKVDSAQSSINGSGDTMIYIAIRRGPMAVPTEGTSVFEPVTTASTAQFSVGFPADLGMLNIRGGNASFNTTVGDRLRGGALKLLTSSTAAESTGYFDFTLQNDFKQSITGADAINYLYRRAPGFFDEVCYTGTGSANYSVAHNLAKVPEIVIIKERDRAVAGWRVPLPFLGSLAADLNLTDAAYDAGGAYFGNGSGYVAPTSTQMTLGSNTSVNNSGTTYVAYLFSTCAGVSKVGSYTGTAATLQINCGFTTGARFVLIKRTDDVGAWYVWDSARGIVAGNDPYLLLNSTAAETTGTDYVDTYSAGFEISSTAPSAINASGGTFIFLAIA